MTIVARDNFSDVYRLSSSRRCFYGLRMTAVELASVVYGLS